MQLTLLLVMYKFEKYLCIQFYKKFPIILFQAYAQKQQLADELYFRLVKAVTAKLNRTLSPTAIEPAAGRLFSAFESTNHKSTILESSNHTSTASLQAHRYGEETRERKTKSKDRQVVPSVLAGGGGVGGGSARHLCPFFLLCLPNENWPHHINI
jgi:hypothetical protein